MSGGVGFRIERLWAALAVHSDGDEGVIALTQDGRTLPLVAADPARLSEIRTVAARVAAETGRPIRIVRFETRVDEEVIGAATPPPAASAPGSTCDNCGEESTSLARWDGSASPVARALEQIGYKTIRAICPACATCDVCGDQVSPSGGAPRCGVFPAVHAECLQKPEAAPFLDRLIRALHGGRDPR